MLLLHLSHHCNVKLSYFVCLKLHVVAWLLSLYIMWYLPYYNDSVGNLNHWSTSPSTTWLNYLVWSRFNTDFFDDDTKLSVYPFLGLIIFRAPEESNKFISRKEKSEEQCSTLEEFSTALHLISLFSRSLGFDVHNLVWSQSTLEILYYVDLSA